jgi:hypothetical protein
MDTLDPHSGYTQMQSENDRGGTAGQASVGVKKNPLYYAKKF